jgi:hypothetical protein
MRIRRYLAPMLRLTLFVCVSAMVLLYFDYRMARASVMERLIGIGRRMAPFMDDARGTETPRQLHINGARMYVAAGHTSSPPSVVRQWYQERYAGRNGGLDELAQKLRPSLPPALHNLNQLTFGNDQQGGVAALDLGDHVSLKELKDRMLKFGETGDLGALARLRYVYYEPTENGGTRFLTIWTDESFPIGRMMANGTKDAEGSDIENIPRFPGAVRLLSADERGRTERIVVYDAPTSPEMAALFYRARMRSLGWTLDERFSDAAAKEGRSALHFVRQPGHEAIVDLSPGDGGGTTVSIMQLR